MDYKASGVDIDAGNEAVRRIRGLARSTFTPAVLSDIGSFGGLFRLEPGRFRTVAGVSQRDPRTGGRGDADVTGPAWRRRSSLDDPDARTTRARVLADDANGVVVGAAVDDNDFNRRVGESRQRIECSRDSRRLVSRRQNDRHGLNVRHWGHECK